MSARYLLLTCSALVTFAAVACDDEPSATFDPERADELAHQMMLEPEDLPGQGWTVTAEDEFDDEDETDNDQLSEDCRAMGEEFDAIDEERGEALGRAGRDFEHDSQSGFPISIFMDAEIYETDEVVQDAQDAAEEIAERDVFADCLLEVFGLSAAEDEDGLSFEVEASSASTSAPEGGYSTAVAGDVVVEGQRVPFRFEIYEWAYGNAQLSVGFVGDPDDLTENRLMGVLDDVQAKVEAAEEDGGD
jgi:hypothetical protein